jgi:signal transduction histidine kinase
VETVGPDGRLQAVAVAHVDPAKEELLRELSAHCLPGLPASLRVLRTGEPLLLPDVCDSVLQSLARDKRMCHIVSDAEQLVMLQTLRPTSAIWVPLVARGRTLGVLGLAWGDSGRRYGPEDLILAQALARHCALAVDNARLYREAQEAIRAREEFLATTSHELRTPLSHIKGFASTLLQPDVEWDEATRQDFLGEIDREADRLGNLISNLLEMSRLESGEWVHPELAPTATAALVARGLDRVRAQLGDRVVDVDVALNSLPPVMADTANIEHVVANLVENAAKYAPESPIRISGTLSDGGQLVEFWVEDDGPGIAPEQMDHLFEKFFRGRTSEQSGIPGTGLGLAIARSIVERHGGRIWAENRPEGGARFVVALPTASSSEMNGDGDAYAPIDPDRR